MRGLTLETFASPAERIDYASYRRCPARPLLRVPFPGRFAEKCVREWWFLAVASGLLRDGQPGRRDQATFCQRPDSGSVTICASVLIGVWKTSRSRQNMPIFGDIFESNRDEF